MTSQLERLAAEVGKLSADDQLELVEEVLARLRIDDQQSMAEAEWNREIADRIDAHRRGETPTFGADEVMAEARSRLRRL